MLAHQANQEAAATKGLAGVPSPVIVVPSTLTLDRKFPLAPCHWLTLFPVTSITARIVQLPPVY